MKKPIKLLLLLILTAALIVGCSNNEPAVSDAPTEKETLVMGLDDTFAPMGFRNEKGELIGFDIELANEAICLVIIILKANPLRRSCEAGKVVLI